MKRKIKMIVITMVLFCGLMGCNKRSDEETVTIDRMETEESVEQMSETVATSESFFLVNNEIPEAYQVILDSLYEDLLLEPNDESAGHVYFTTGIHEVAICGDSAEERLNMIAYCIEDINNDGNEELIIFDASLEDEVLCDRILDLYTISGNEAVGLGSGWARNRYYILNDSMIYNEGSGGAVYSSCQLFKLDSGATELTGQDLYFTYPKEDNSGGYYYSEEAIYDVTLATEVTSEEYASFRDDCLKKIKLFDGISIGKYKNCD